MARYKHLPILRQVSGQVYKKVIDLTIYFEKVVRHFSRYHEYTLASELREKSREIVELVIKAERGEASAPLELREGLEGLMVFLQTCKEVRAFNSFDSYVYASNLVVELSRQNEGWIKSRTKGGGQNSRSV